MKFKDKDLLKQLKAFEEARAEHDEKMAFDALRSGFESFAGKRVEPTCDAKPLFIPLHPYPKYNLFQKIYWKVRQLIFRPKLSKEAFEGAVSKMIKK